MDVEGMFTNDIIGSSTSDKGRRDPFTVRLFSEGVPTTETPAQAALRQSIGGENDGPVAPARALRQGGRRELGHRDARAADLAPRPLPARRRPDPVPAAGLSGGALHRAGGELRPPAPGRARGERPAVRRPAAVRRLRLHRARGAGQRRGARQPGVGADGAQERQDRHDAAHQRHDAELGRQPRARPRGLRGGVARVDRSAVDAHDPGGQRHTFTIPDLSKDNVQVGVRAVDRDGYRSPVAFPVPSHRIAAMLFMVASTSRSPESDVHRPALEGLERRGQGGARRQGGRRRRRPLEGRGGAHGLRAVRLPRRRCARPRAGEPADRQRTGCRREDDELAGLPLRAVRRVPGRDRRGRG